MHRKINKSFFKKIHFKEDKRNWGPGTLGQAEAENRGEGRSLKATDTPFAIVIPSTLHQVSNLSCPGRAEQTSGHSPELVQDEEGA